MATATIYAGAGSGELRGPASAASFAAERSGSTASSVSTADGSFGAYADYNAGGWSTYALARGALPFDLSTIPSGAVIQDIQLYVKCANKFSVSFSDSVAFVGTTQASLTALATSDYGLFGATRFVDTDASYAGWTIGSYRQFALNSAAIASATTGAGGKLRIGTMLTCDFANTGYPSSSGSYSGVTFNFTSASGTSSDPYIVVTYTTDKLTSDTWAWSDSPSVYWRARRTPTTVRAEGLNTQLNGGQAGNSGTITVDTTSGWPSSGSFRITDYGASSPQTVVTYTGKTGTTFTGCTGGSGATFADNSPVQAEDAESHFPQVTPLSTGVNPALLVSYHQHGGHSALNGCIKAKKSIDGGLTWASETTLLSGPVNGSGYGIYGHAMARLLTGRLLMLWYEHDLSGTNVKSYIAYSDDNGVTFNTPTRLTSPFHANYCAVGFSTLLYTGSGSNGTYGDLYVTAYGTDDGYDTTGDDHYSRLLKITDGGAGGTWTSVSTIATMAQTGGYANGEAGIAVVTGGTWLCHLRVETADRDRWQCISTDNGVTWTGHAQAVAKLGNAAVNIVMPEGHVVTQGQELRSAGGGTTGSTVSYFSTDNGTTWPTTLWRQEELDATYSVGNGSDFETITDTSITNRRVVNAYANERSNQGGAQVRFQWYAVPDLAGFPLLYDSWAWSDSVTYVRSAMRSTSDAWAWTDSAASGALTWSRTTSDAWAWGDSGSVPVNAQRTTGDNLAWSDSATWAPVYLARTSSDAWAWADALARALVLGATAADAWIWTDSATRVGGALYYSRTTVDTWSWTDAIGASAATFYWFRTRRSDMSTPTKTYVQVLPKGTTRTSTYTSPTYRAETEAGILVVLDVTAASGTGGLTLRINAHDQASAQAIPLNAAPTAVTATGTTSYALYPFGAIAGNVTQATSFYLPRMFSITVTHEDSSSYTYSLGYCLLP